MPKKIIYISDFDFKASGYFNLSIPLCSGLIEAGHELKVLGLGYKGDNHTYPFSIIPAANFQEITAMMQNFTTIWPFDCIVVALDIPLQEQLLRIIGNRPPNIKYVGIMPIEADPLVLDWAMVLLRMNKALIISEFGTEEARKLHIDAEHLPIGIDTNSWRFPTVEEKVSIRKSMGIGLDEFIVLTVADNQERKNLWAAFDIFSEFNKEIPNSKYILVTREFSPVGWKLRTMAQDMGFASNLMLFERGMEFKKLWSLYAMSDCFMLTSKAEGLGLPLLEAMAVGLPCIATNCCGMKELLSDGRGFLVDWEYKHVDPFGNGNRYWINRQQATKVLHYIHEFKRDIAWYSRKYVETRTWDKAKQLLNRVVEE